MSYEKGNIGYKSVTKNTLFSLEGMLMPFFVNNGNNSVIVNHTTLKPGAEFRINFPFVMQGEIPIQFLNDNTTGNPDKFQLNVYFGQPGLNNCNIPR